MELLKFQVLTMVKRFINVGTVIQRESFMYMNPKYLNMMLLITIIVLLTSSCTRDFNLNPWTTVMKEVIINDK